MIKYIAIRNKYLLLQFVFLIVTLGCNNSTKHDLRKLGYMFTTFQDYSKKNNDLTSRIEFHFDSIKIDNMYRLNDSDYNQLIKSNDSTQVILEKRISVLDTMNVDSNLTHLKKKLLVYLKKSNYNFQLCFPIQMKFLKSGGLLNLSDREILKEANSRLMESGLIHEELSKEFDKYALENSITSIPYVE